MILICIISSIYLRTSTAEKLFSDEQHIIDNLLRSGDVTPAYDWRVRPRGFVESRESSLRRQHLATQYSGNISVETNDIDSEDDFDRENEPVVIMANMYLSEDVMVLEAFLKLTTLTWNTLEWTDERLLFYSNSLSHIILSPDQRIFLPDTFFQNEKNGKKHNIDKPNVMIRVYNATARVLYSCRLTLTLSCPMYLEAYPLDTQTCLIDYASYAYTTKDIVYVWKSDKPIQIKPGLKMSLPSFVLSGVFIGNCTSETNTGSYSCLRTIIHLKREFSYYLLQLYIPSFMLVVVSNVSFWLDKDSVPARVTLGTTVLLTVTTMASGINANLPPVSYTKSVDIWIGVCTGFIFGALLEFSLVNWAARKEAFERTARVRRFVNANPLLERRYRLPMVAALANRASFSGFLPLLSMDGNSVTVDIASASQSPIIDHQMPQSYQPALKRYPVTDVQLNARDRNRASPLRAVLDSAPARWWSDLWHTRYREKSKRIDLLARVLFPFFFIIFNIIYWIRYLRPYLNVRSEMEEEL